MWVVVVQTLSHVWLCDPMNCSMPGFPVLHHHLEFAQTHDHWVSDAIQTSHPLGPFSSCPQSFPASGSLPVSQLFASGGQSIGSFSFNISPSNEHPGLICLDWLDLLAVQGTLKSLPEHSNHCMQNNRSYFLKFDTTDFNINLSLSFVFLTKTSVFF